MTTKRKVVALIGPKKDQLDRVSTKLGKGYLQAFDLRVVDRSGNRGLPNADLFVVWTRYAGTKMLSVVKSLPSTKVRRIETFNVDTLSAILGPEPEVEVTQKKVTPPPPTTPTGSTADFELPKGDDFRFVNDKLAYIRCGKCESWRPVSAYADNPAMKPHGKNRLCKTCMSSINGANAHKAAKKREEEGRQLVAQGKIYYQGKKLCQACWRYKQPTRSFDEVEKEPDGLDTTCKACREKQRKAEERKAALDAERAAKEAAKAKEREEREALKALEREERERAKAEEEARKKAEAERKAALGTHEDRISRLEAKFDQILDLLTDPDSAIPSLVLEEAEQNADKAAAQAQAQAAELIRQAMGDLPPKALGKMKAQLQSALALLGDAGPDGA